MFLVFNQQNIFTNILNGGSYIGSGGHYYNNCYDNLYQMNTKMIQSFSFCHSSHFMFLCIIR